MRIDTVKIRNFRLLRRLTIDLSKKTATILVGPNNSGKTSVMDALRLFVGAEHDTRKISLHDLSQLRQGDFKRIEKRLSKEYDPEKKIAVLRRYAPRMRMDLIFSYSEAMADLVVATNLLMGLQPSNCVRLRIEYGIDNAKGLVDDFETRRNESESLCEFLKDKYKLYFGRTYYKVSENGREVEQLEDGGIIKHILKIDVIAAQRHVDDDESHQAAKLSKLLHEHYTKYYKANDAAGFYVIEDALKESAGDLTIKYAGAFSRLITRLKEFGYPHGQEVPDLRIRAEMNSETVYRDNARIYYGNEYAGQDGAVETLELPEKYNGLGYKNLIFIVLQLESFRAAVEAEPIDRPRIHMMAIEEPEAHLHPQMQNVFINEISKSLDASGGTTAQVVISTHSAHMIANSGFEPVRYFRRSGRQVIVRDLSKLPLLADDVAVLDQQAPGSLSEAELAIKAESVRDFLRRYIRLTHCDLFFADKVIFVEGQVERLLLPLMIEKYIKPDGAADLACQYISISEIGGGHAHKFKPIIDFIGVPTLIITDLDSLNGDGEKCKVSEGQGTSNFCLRSWIPAKSTISELAACDATAKTLGNIRIAYQTAEHNYCGRSFEEAFLYANKDWLTTNHTKLTATRVLVRKAVESGLFEAAWDFSQKVGKVDFALDLMANPGWKTPAYIHEGLAWLAGQGPSK